MRERERAYLCLLLFEGIRAVVTKKKKKKKENREVITAVRVGRQFPKQIEIPFLYFLFVLTALFTTVQ